MLRVLTIITTLTFANSAQAGGLIVGGKVVNLTPFTGGEAHPHFGGGAFVEVGLIPHTLELELSISALSDHGLLVPIDLLAKYPIELNKQATVFVGAGPVVALHSLSEGDLETYFGFATVAGLYFWMTDSVGILAQFGYNGLFEHGHYVSELAAAAGVALKL